MDEITQSDVTFESIFIEKNSNIILDIIFDYLNDDQCDVVNFATLNKNMVRMIKSDQKSRNNVLFAIKSEKLLIMKGVRNEEDRKKTRTETACQLGLVTKAKRYFPDVCEYDSYLFYNLAETAAKNHHINILNYLLTKANSLAYKKEIVISAFKHGLLNIIRIWVDHGCMANIITEFKELKNSPETEVEAETEGLSDNPFLFYGILSDWQQIANENHLYIIRYLIESGFNVKVSKKEIVQGAQ